MKSSRLPRWDLVIGALASLVAVSGFLFSLAVGNTATVGFGTVHLGTQKFMAVLAGVFLLLLIIKTAIRYRPSCQATCVWSLERFLRGSRASRRPR